MPGMPTIDDYADDFIAVLDDRGIDRAVFVGHSLGGYVAQHAILRTPARCKALVVIGSTLISTPLSVGEAVALRLTSLALHLWPWESLKKLTARNIGLRPEVQAYMTSALAPLDKPGFLRIWNGVRTAISTQGFPALPPELPVLWTHGDRDRTGNIARDASRILAEPLRRLTYHEIPDASHNANQDNADDFNATLVLFLATLAPGGE